MNALRARDQILSAVGIVIPVAWDENGNPGAFAISTYEETEYLIDGRNAAGRELMQMAQQKVRVYGKLGSPVNNRRLLTVTRFEPDV